MTTPRTKADGSHAEAAPGTPASKRVPGLDAIRFVLAAWVVLGHYGVFPIFLERGAPFSLIEFLRVGYENTGNGPAAVIVFFVISGFCIHFPYRHTEVGDLRAFYLRRNIRIVLPAAVAVLTAGWVGVKIAVLGDSILWSLVCEEIYYLLYPLIRWLGQRYGFTLLTTAAFIAAILLATTKPGAENYPSFGLSGNWLLGLPCWLTGCCLAQSYDPEGLRRAGTTRSVWTWRVAALAVASSASILRFHTPLTYPWTLNFVAIFAFFWLRREIGHALRYEAGFLEPLGAFSYSLYLFREHARALWDVQPFAFDTRLNWLLRFGWILLATWLAYLLVERPSHRLARWIAARLSKHSPPDAVRVRP